MCASETEQREEETAKFSNEARDENASGQQKTNALALRMRRLPDASAKCGAKIFQCHSQFLAVHVNGGTNLAPPTAAQVKNLSIKQSMSMAQLGSSLSLTHTQHGAALAWPKGSKIFGIIIKVLDASDTKDSSSLSLSLPLSLAQLEKERSMGQLQFCDCYNNFLCALLLLLLSHAKVAFCFGTFVMGKANQMKFAASLENLCDKASKSKTTKLSSSAAAATAAAAAAAATSFSCFVYGLTTAAATKTTATFLIPLVMKAT